ncbi:hypothetical protein HU200_031261 [Digitaria exilis]|uniref:Uncharacterized protein n=1 Tax=Digitaria exilis TaxID=1010633 RepID=A0A835BQE8_9POAL|nr:hypothetical protein HU200_031261 [Digitaria exilis]CAB3476297.1 unnamed protein product [Digitaria exilis]
MLPGPGNSRRPEEAAESGGGASKLHHGGLLGLATCSMAINLVVVCEPPPGLDKNAYYLLALSVIFFAGVAHVFAAVSASDDDPRGRVPSKLKYVVSIAPFVIAAGLSVASFMW